MAVGLVYTCGLFDKVGQTKLICWGYNGNNQLGYDGKSGLFYYIGLEYDWFVVSVGDVHICGIVKGGELFCWGVGDYGNLGNGI